ncbi:MAG: 50S ribosomal protein L13 [Deltaproteobacteria bacterium]|jgi:large subunit ribosomal protein L13|nr:50S ribosomal protein L13 [Deltaproteobacteria bacterium]
MGTYYANKDDVERRWFIVDAAEQPLGRTATHVARILQGKTKPTYTPNVDVGDCVVVFNAEKVQLTGNKLDDKLYYHHTGWVGSLNSTSAREMLASKPEEVIRLAVKGMLPRSRLGTAMLRKLKVHAGPLPDHGYAAQKAEPLEIGK